MDEFKERLLTNRRGEHNKSIGIDSVVFIYQMERHPIYWSLANSVLTSIADHRNTGVASMITLMEITIHPWRATQEMVAREYETFLVHFPNLQLVDINRSIARHAAQLRARFGILTPDAIQVAAALEYGATGFVTNDLALQRLAQVIDVIVLQEFVRG